MADLSTAVLRQILRNSSLLGVSAGVAALIGVGQSVLLARELGSVGLGILFAATSIPSTIAALASFRTQEPLTRWLCRAEVEGKPFLAGLAVRRALTADLSTLLFAAALILIASPFIARELVAGSCPPLYFELFGLALVFQVGENAWLCIQRHTRSFGVISLRQILLSVLQFCCIVFLWHTDILSVWNVVLVYLGVGFVTALLSLPSVFVFYRRNQARTVNVAESRSESLDADKQFWTEMWLGFWSGTSSALVKNFDVVLLSWFCGPRELGIYRVAKQLAAIPTRANAVLSSATIRDLVDLVSQNNIRAALDSSRFMLRVWSPPILIGTFILAACSELIVRSLYGDDFDGAALPFRILVIGTGFSMALFWVQPLLVSVGGFRTQFIISQFLLVFSLLVALLTVGPFQATGVAFALSTSWILGHLLILYYSHRALLRLLGTQGTFRPLVSSGTHIET